MKFASLAGSDGRRRGILAKNIQRFGKHIHLKVNRQESLLYFPRFRPEGVLRLACTLCVTLRHGAEKPGS
jgi:hypothetical protein